MSVRLVSGGRVPVKWSEYYVRAVTGRLRLDREGIKAETVLLPPERTSKPPTKRFDYKTFETTDTKCQSVSKI